MTDSEKPLVQTQPVIHRVEDARSGGIEGIPWSRFRADWQGKEATMALRYRLWVDKETLVFAVCVDFPAPEAAPGEKTGAFLPRLWERDVAELFLREAGATRYEEWNVSPRGAWWSQGFERERVPAPGYEPPDGVRAHGECDLPGWRASLEIPLQGREPREFQVNVTLILGTGSGSGRRFFALASRPSIPPDFHMINDYPIPVFERF